MLFFKINAECLFEVVGSIVFYNRTILVVILCKYWMVLRRCLFKFMRSKQNFWVDFSYLLNTYTWQLELMRYLCIPKLYRVVRSSAIFFGLRLQNYMTSWHWCIICHRVFEGTYIHCNIHCRPVDPANFAWTFHSSKFSTLTLVLIGLWNSLDILSRILKKLGRSCNDIDTLHYTITVAMLCPLQLRQSGWEQTVPI